MAEFRWHEEDDNRGPLSPRERLIAVAEGIGGISGALLIGAELLKHGETFGIQVMTSQMPEIVQRFLDILP